MDNNHYFETPENIKIAYQPAGLGSRYLAFFVDNILMVFFFILLFIALTLLGIVSENSFRGSFISDNDLDESDNIERFMLLFISIIFMVWALGSFFYFGLSEYLLKGQTLGKKMMKIRVVQSDGFSLDAGGIFIRTIFRIIDQMPVFWIVPFVSSKSQRFGDMVAGTIVVADQKEKISNVRSAISERTSDTQKFRFDAFRLKKLRPQDYTGIETFLERYHNLNIVQQEKLMDQFLTPITQILDVDMPIENERVLFLQDLLASEYKRQNRLLG